VRHRIRVAGVVQGVGFRPFVHRLATQLGLTGHVGNDTEGVVVEVEGGASSVAVFEARLVTDAPPLARIFSIDGTPVEARHDQGFRIVESRATGAVGTFVSPDVAVCDDCLAELFDPADRRSRYPFINCTNCGPRFTITLRLPYDRPNTTMRGSPCATPVGWSTKTPRTAGSTPSRWPVRTVARGSGSKGRLATSTAVVEGTDAAIAAAQRALAGGAVVAIKGLGGYHLACDAASSDAVDTLRRRKARQDKPLAVMVGDLATARRLAHIDRFEAALLADPSARSSCWPGATARPSPPGSLPTTRTSGSSCPTRRSIICSSAACRGRMKRSRGPGDDQRQPLGRAHLLRRRGRPDPTGPDRRRLAGPRPPHPRALR
jgi:hydrogenase maturation protein HypF